MLIKWLTQLEKWVRKVGNRGCSSTKNKPSIDHRGIDAIKLVIWNY